MKRHPGASLLIVLLFSLTAALILTTTFLLFSWSQGSTAASWRQDLDRAALSSLVWTCRHWLSAHVPAKGGGSLPTPSEFSELIIHTQTEGDATSNIYDLDYTPQQVQREQWTEEGPGGFFPPRPNAFLIRAFRRRGGGTGRMLEAVFVREEGQNGPVLVSKPIFWREVWF